MTAVAPGQIWTMIATAGGGMMRVRVESIDGIDAVCRVVSTGREMRCRLTVLTMHRRGARLLVDEHGGEVMQRPAKPLIAADVERPRVEQLVPPRGLSREERAACKAGAPVKLFWLDLETTGLNPREDQVLEIAVSEADLSAPFNAREVFHAVLALPYVKLDPFIVEMHTKNGLLEECAKSTGTAAWADAYLLGIIPEVQDKEDRPVLAGNSVHFDLAFLRHHMPRAAARLSHRVYDVSAITLFARSLGMPHKKGDPAHRARDDVRASIHQASTVANWLDIHRAACT